MPHCALDCVKNSNPVMVKEFEALRVTLTPPVITVCVTPAPCNVIDLPFTVTAESHVAVPAGTWTVSPPLAALIAPCTFDLEQSDATIVAPMTPPAFKDSTQATN